MMALACRYLVEGIANAAFISSGLPQGKPQIWCSDRTMATLGAVLLLRTLFLE
jgi:hypothetical protein